jgi:hypothetical protein
MTTALATRPVKFNEEGKVTAGFNTFEVPMPEGTGTKVTVCVGYFPRRPGVPAAPDDLPGWRAEATINRIDVTVRSAACRERAHAISDAIEALTNRLVDASDRARGSQRHWLKTVIDAVTAWGQAFDKQARKEQPTAMTVHAKSAKILSGKECRALLEDFRRCYETCMHSFLELGEKAATIREQEAYGETCETFDDWIRSEGFGHTFIYDCMKASRLYRLMAPTLDPKKITLDCESHYRDIPADVTAKEAKAIASELVKLAGTDTDGTPKVTRRQVKEAVAAVRPKPAAARSDVPESIEEEIAGVEKPYGRAGPQAPRLAAETISGEYVEVGHHVPMVADTPACAKGLAALPLVDAETPPTWSAELTCARINLARWLQRWEACDEFRYEAERMLEDLAVSLKTHTLGGAVRSPARRAK